MRFITLVLVLSSAAGGSLHAVAGFLVPARDRCADELQRDRRRVAFFATRLGVRPTLALAVVREESNWKPAAVSEKGARGLMQVMPATAVEYGLDPTRLHEFDYGAYAGLLILRDLLDRFQGSEPLALAAYYAGPGFSRRRYSAAVGQDIERYVSEVLERSHVAEQPCD